MESKKEGTLTCKYCGRTGFFNIKSLSIHRRFSKSCLEKWKKEQEEIDNSKSKVKCAICGEYLRNISNTHLKKHNMTQQEYKCQFPDSPIFSDGLLDLQKEKREATIVERYGNNNKIRAITKETFIKNNGEKKGIALWNEFLEKRQHQGSLQWYCEKYGEQEGTKLYNERCDSLVGRYTLAWFCEKYGEQEGIDRYNENRKIQSECRRLEKYIEKYGEEEGTKKFNEINNKKRPTLSNFIRKYGEEEGAKRWNKMIGNRSEFKQSKVAMELFETIALKVQDKKVYYYNHPKEYGVMVQEDKIYCLLDFYCIDTNKVIEFYGDYWHANPNIYNENDMVFYPGNKSVVAKDVWEKDKKRIERIRCQMNCQIMIVWESDFVNHKKETIKKVVEFLKS